MTALEAAQRIEAMEKRIAQLGVHKAELMDGAFGLHEASIGSFLW